jgi:glutathione S-transferase
MPTLLIRLMAREAWQATEATPEVMEAFKSRMAARMAQQNAG